jgi:hypothetical protein
VSQKNLMSPAGPGTKNDCADEAHPEIYPTDRVYIVSVGGMADELEGTDRYIRDVISHYLRRMTEKNDKPESQ